MAILIIGSGLTGAVLAERYAVEKGLKVTVVERSANVGGLCHDFLDAQGILVPSHGPHFFHTSSREVWDYLGRFGEWHPYEHRVLSYVDNKFVPVPVNILTVNRLFGLNIATAAEMAIWLSEHREKIEQPRNAEEEALANVGRVLYEKLFKYYTKKQWDYWPHELDAALIKRIPVRNNFDDRYFSDTIQAMPTKGFGKLIERMLDHKNIDVILNMDFGDIQDNASDFKSTFYTGRIDAFFNYEYGVLQYRSLDFETRQYATDYFQPAAVVNYPNEFSYMRVTEPKHSMHAPSYPMTTVVYEYPSWGTEPYYPVPTNSNLDLYRLYLDKTIPLESRGVFFAGRLATYRHLDMDKAVTDALGLFRRQEF
jgi:UDP-galactopyranose mutase